MSRRILIVEDNPGGREMLRLLLELWGYEVQVAEDGPRGVGTALRWRPDVAVIDIGLPGLTGHQVATQIRAALDGAIRLIALTAYCTERDAALAAGFDVFLTKPAAPAELERALAG